MTFLTSDLSIQPGHIRSLGIPTPIGTTLCVFNSRLQVTQLLCLQICARQFLVINIFSCLHVSIIRGTSSTFIDHHKCFFPNSKHTERQKPPFVNGMNIGPKLLRSMWHCVFRGSDNRNHLCAFYTVFY